MFMIATIQTIVSGMPTADGQRMDADERESEPVDPDAEPGQNAAAAAWPPSFPYHGRPRKSSTIPTVTATAAPSSSPRFS